MERWDLDKTSPGRLSQLLRDDPAAPVWCAKDLEAIIHHRLSVPLQTDLGRELVPLDSKLSASSGPDRFEGLARMTFAELLLHPRPPEEALRLVKSFAKAWRSDAAPLLPAEVATAVYYAAILAAEMRLDRNISTLDKAALRTGVDWALSRGWIVDPLRSLCAAAKKVL
jgi:hypothetical protein